MISELKTQLREALFDVLSKNQFLGNAFLLEKALFKPFYEVLQNPHEIQAHYDDRGLFVTIYLSGTPTLRLFVNNQKIDELSPKLQSGANPDTVKLSEKDLPSQSHPTLPLPILNVVEERTWDEFRETGLLFHINQILHPFGWAISVQLDENDHAEGTTPVRVRYRGFGEEIQSEQHIKIANYLAKTAFNFPAEIEETGPSAPIEPEPPKFPEDRIERCCNG